MRFRCLRACRPQGGLPEFVQWNDAILSLCVASAWRAPLVLSLIAISVLAACSNDLMNSAVWSEERRMEKFREYHDREIGEPYYGQRSEVCVQRECLIREDGWLEITHERTFEEGCTIAWEVEPTETSRYHHPNGMVFDIVGIKKSWNYVSDPENCLFGLDWEGPW